MSPLLKLFWIVFVLGLALSIYSLVEMMRAPSVTQREDLLPKMIENGCLAYFMKYNRVPPCVDNQKLTAALTGDNSQHIAFISLSKDELNSDKEMLDPWGTPYQVHPQGGNGVQIISAGPDKIFGTPDDIVTNGVDKDLNK
jgi:hypothetical protein